ncbi:MAG TPA: hypothetical protein VLX44_14810 [Xanthobacteraceae bacterium]|nr:hypothetical protein [Xanthobacteraceae bacterium]
MLVALIALAAAAPLARAAPAGGEAAPATEHARDAAPPGGTPHERGSHAATGAHRGPVESGESARHTGDRSVGPGPGDGAKGGAAHAPAIDPRPLPVPRITSRPIKDLLPKPFTTARPRPRHAPAFAIAVPARNAIGIPLDHAPIARPATSTPGLRPAATGATGTPAGGLTALHQTPVPPIPSGPRNMGLDGTAVGRVGTGPATVGGAARITTGIDGTRIRPKHGN